ncbi:MAG: hypothetical protein PW789_08060 [Edaphobacter sp.]|uniref:hypothetical protein n=1 Tax=Edaphobacter sp. TaxID=1934404 RepID=UPI002395A026|nr:hypothetical protein [Edaphobacter sp.]MDE1176548.1 hypothetical protein [Edaphobacter sp.]
MNIRNVFAAAIVATSFVATPMVHAAGLNSPVHAMFAKTKTVKIVLMNDSGSPMEIKAGDEVIKLDAGKPVTVNLPEGTRMVSNTTTEKSQAGSLIAQVSSSLNGATIHIK